MNTFRIFAVFVFIILGVVPGSIFAIQPEMTNACPICDISLDTCNNITDTGVLANAQNHYYADQNYGDYAFLRNPSIQEKTSPKIDLEDDDTSDPCLKTSSLKVSVLNTISSASRINKINSLFFPLYLFKSSFLL